MGASKLDTMGLSNPEDFFLQLYVALYSYPKIRLTWACFAERPLALDEFRDALAERLV